MSSPHAICQLRNQKGLSFEYDIGPQERTENTRALFSAYVIGTFRYPQRLPYMMITLFSLILYNFVFGMA
jgi:hypothetical protein